MSGDRATGYPLLGSQEKRKFSCLCRVTNPGHPDRSLGAIPTAKFPNVYEGESVNRSQMEVKQLSWA
jgi:hypothetical protein